VLGFKVYPQHGGDLYSLEKALGLSADAIIDLSTSVNPLPLPKNLKRVLIKSLDLINRYPDPLSRSFKETLYEIYSIPPENIVCGNGSSELIYVFIKALSPKRVLILEPTFSEYERASTIGGASIHRVFSLDKETLLKKAVEKLSETKIDLVFVCNPNNPTGWFYKKEELLPIIKAFPSTNFLIDEAFIEFVEDETLIKEAAELDNLIVLRSLTKFYGLSGLRFGYAVSSKDFIKKAQTFLPPWNVNILAQTIAGLLIKDPEFKEKSLRFFTREKRRFEKKLKELSVSFFPSVANYYLLKLIEEGFFEFCLKHNILIRNCANFYGLDSRFVRISIKSKRWNNIFFEVLEKWLRKEFT